jgi:hypothetical protein
MLKLSRFSALLFVAAPLALAACKKADAPPPAEAPPPAVSVETGPASVSVVNVGRAIGPDKHITAGADTIRRNDPMYVSVATNGRADNAVLLARWFAPDGVIIRSDSQTVNLAGPAVHEFHITRSQPWPVGRFKVDIMLNGQVAGSKEWEVRP